MKRHTVRQRLAAVFLAALMSLSWLPPLPAFAENTPTETTSAAESDVSASASENKATPETSEPESNVVEDETSEDDTSLSEAAQKFVDSVNALDRDSILNAVNTWALASQAWQAEKDNPDLTAALETATAASDEAAAPVYAAEDLYIALADEDKAQEAVQTAYSALAALFVTMQLTMENPTVPEEGGGNPPDQDEIATVLYGELPDAPTGSYMGSYGLPIATGDTKIGIGYWGNELLSADNQGRLDAQALNSDAMTIVVPRQDGESYAVVPIMVEVEYPANNSTSQVILPDNVTVLDYDGTEADTEETRQILSVTYVETSAAATGFYVKAEDDFVAEFSYTAPDGNKLHKTLQVKLGESTATKASAQSNGITTYAATPTPPWTTGKITSIAYEGGTWLVWFNGVEAYCCSHGLNGQPNGCPTYTFSYVSKLEPGQYTPGAHYLNQINIWGGLNQLSLGLLSQKHNPDEYISSDFAAGSASTYSTAENDTLKAAYQYYDDTQLWIIKNYPESAAAKAYLSAAAQLLGANNRASTFSSGKGYYTYIYNPPAGYAWQIIALIGPEITDEGGGTDIPDIPDAEYYSANWTAPAQSASGSFDLTFTVNADKQQLETGEKVDGAKITVTPSKTSGSIDGGSWQMNPAGAQTITTTGHTNDDNYQNNGGDGTVSWTVHYEVSKTSTTTLSGQEGPYSSQAEADAAAEAAKNAAISQLQAEAQSMVDAAIAAARAELATIRFSYDEVEIPYGFEEFNGSLGSHQTITVPADSSNDYVMKNDEWSLQVNLKKVDSETGEQITGDALYEVYEWDTVTQQYIPFGGYNQYTVVRNEDGTYSVANGTDYGTEYDTSRKMYYTQRNEGKFIIVETRAPSGYYGDWTDVEHPGIAGTPLGKRAYYIEITKANDGSVITLDNTHYSADIATSYTGGTKLLTSGGVETTVTIYKASDEPAAEIQYQDAGRTYNTDNSGTAANEDSYTMTPQTGVMQNDRVLGEISLSKIDLDAVRYVGGRDTDGDALASGQAHADARLDGAVYDLYAAEDIQHPDGVTGTVDYSKITYADGTPIWHTTIRDNSGQWVDDYLPVLAKDHLVASAVIKDGWLTFSNLYLGKYYIVERGTGVVIPVEDGTYKLSGTYPDVDGKTKEPTGTTSQLATNSAGQYTDYNTTLTAAGDFKNGSGDGWVATGRPNEYQLAEIFSNDTGTIRVQGLPYGQYLVVETTTPKDVFQAEPFIVTIDPTDESNPQSAMANPKDAVQTPSGSYQKFTVLDEEIEVYLRVTKIDEETGKAVLLKDTAFQIYWMDEQGNHIYDENGNAKLVTMTDTTNPLLPKDVDTFYTDDTGMLVLPEKLPLGHYRLVEVNGPNGYFNEWVASAVYEDGHLQIDDTGNFADGSFYVDFSVTTERVYKATGDDSEDSQDILVIDEDYQNNETLGVLKIRKTGEVLIGWQEDEGGTFDPEFSGEARPGHFVYEERPIPYAEYTITANEDIYTQDRQTDANGNRTLWYAKGDVVAVVRTGDGTSDIAAFAPGRTNSTYDFLSVIHDGTVGEVSVTLPLGAYHVEETTAPYGFVGTKQSYDVTFVWDKQTNDVVLAKTVTSNPGDGSASETENYEIVNVKDASDAQVEAQVLKFHNERVKPQLDIYKRDIKTGALVAGAVYNLITVDDIYSATGDLLFRAGDLIATSAPTDENGHTTFTCDFPMRGEFYGMEGVRIPENTTANSGKYRIVELRPPQGYYLDAPDQEFEFVYQGAETSVIEMENTFENDATSFFVSKRKLTGDEELPGAILTIQDKDGNVVRQWVSGNTPTEIRGLQFDKIYTLVETAAPNGYEVAESIRFKLVQRKDEKGDLLNEADVYVCTGKDWLIFDHWTLLEDGMVVMRDAPSPDTPENPSPTPTPTPEQPVETPAPTPKPVASLPQTGDNTPIGLLAGIAAAAGIAFGFLMRKRCRHNLPAEPEIEPLEDEQEGDHNG